MFTKSGGVIVDGVNAAGDVLDMAAVAQLPVSTGTYTGPGSSVQGGSISALSAAQVSVGLVTGQLIYRNPNVIVNSGAENNGPSLPPQNPGPNATFVNGGDIGYFIATPNAGGSGWSTVTGPGDILGVYQGGGIAPIASGAALTQVAPLRKVGVGWVLSQVVSGGTAVTLGAALNGAVLAGSNEANVASRVIGQAVGKAVAYPINTAITAAAGPGTALVVPVSNWTGITTSTQLFFDTGALQETVTPSATATGVAASQTITAGGTAAAGQTWTVTIGGGTSGFPTYVITYVTQAGDTTATIGAQSLAAVINNSAAVLAPFVRATQSLLNRENQIGFFSPVLQVATNAAGVITLRAYNFGSPQNAIPLTCSSSGGFTLTAGGATFTGGSDSTVTVTLNKAHAAGAVVQGVQNAAGGTVLPVPAAGTASALLPVDLNVLA